MPNAQAEAYKAEGNALFKAQNFSGAIEKYKLATSVDDTVPAYWSNMSACYEKLGDFAGAADSAQGCIKADKNFIKGYFRLAVAQKGLGQLAACIKTLESGLGINASNPDLKRMKKEVTELKRNEDVKVLCQTAEAQLQNGDIAAAYKSLELASRQDAGNPEIERMMGKVKPKYDAMEARRRSGLSPNEALKEKGDDAYKNAQFEKAIEYYTKCIDSLGHENQSELMIKTRSNRAACYKQISNFDGTIEDCTMVLEADPENVKALVRRAQAFEAVERYRMALQDVKSVLQMPFHKVGKANFDLCNGLQHRLNRTVAQLKAMG
jgi:stress-induced-phosphoprotein 1